MKPEGAWVDGDEQIATLDEGEAKVTIATSRSRSSRALIVGVRLASGAERTAFVSARQLDAFLDAVIEARRRARAQWPRETNAPPWGTFAGPRRARSGQPTTDETSERSDDADGAAEGEEKAFPPEAIR